MSPNQTPGMGLARDGGRWASARTGLRPVTGRGRDAYGRGPYAASAPCEAKQPTTSTDDSLIGAPWTHPGLSHMSPVLLHGVLLLRGSLAQHMPTARFVRQALDALHQKALHPFV